MTNSAEFSYIGQPIESIDAQEKASGEAKFLQDIIPPGMLYGKILRSPYPHARIVRIDTRRARELGGVKAVITAEETPKIKFCFLPQFADKYIFAEEKVRFIGDEVAAVAAVDQDIAEEALDLIEIEYEELPAVYNPEEALMPDAPKIHDNDTNVALKVFRDYGDVEKGFALADQVFTHRYATQRVTHCCLETRGCIATFHQSGKITIYSTTQAPYCLRNELASILGIPQSHIRVLKTHMGGGFGSRIVMDMLEPIASLLSKHTRKPVGVFNTRKEEFRYSAVRYPFDVELKTGVKNDGILIARQANIIVDNGAYNEKGPVTLANASLSFIYLYRAPHVRLNGSLVYTNNLHGSAFRGFGNPQISFAMECQMDVIAEKLGIDPAELRLKNIFNGGEKTVSGATIKGDGLSRCIKESVKQSGWNSWKSKKERQKNEGMGIAIMVHTGGGARAYKYNSADAFIHIHEDGKANVLVGVSEHGQGAKTVLAQIAAEELGISPKKISISETDTDVNPMDIGAYASRTTYVLGNAVRSAAINVKKQILSSAAIALEANPDDLEIKNESIHVKGSSGVAISVNDAIKNHYTHGNPLSGQGRFHDEIPDNLDPMTGYGDLFPAYSFSCLVARVKVNPDTGEVNILELTSANDLGRIINPLGAEGQIEGALLQGIGYSMLEECIVDEGKILNGNLLDYKYPTSQDLCSIRTILVETNENTGPFGAKGVGEAAIVPVVPAIANAIYDAIGIRLDDLPFKKEKIYDLARKKAVGIE